MHLKAKTIGGNERRHPRSIYRCIFLFFAAMLVLARLAFAPPAGAEIYYWIDENGVKRYSNTPPPENVKTQVLFNEYQYDAAADRRRTESDQRELQAIIKEIEAEERRLKAEQERRAEEQPLSREEKIEKEKERLLDKIEQLEAQPLDRFGSQRNKIRTVGYYKYRLEALMNDPDKYFREPVPFEGNPKYLE